MVGGGRVCGWEVTWCFYWIEREGENERLDSPKSKKESVNGTLPPLLRLVLLFYVFSSWKDLPLSLLAISVSLPNPPPPFYPNPPYIYYYILYVLLCSSFRQALSLFPLHSIPLHRRRRSIQAPTTNTPPPVAVPASQPSGSYSTPSPRSHSFP